MCPASKVPSATGRPFRAGSAGGAEEELANAVVAATVALLQVLDEGLQLGGFQQELRPPKLGMFQKPTWEFLIASTRSEHVNIDLS